ncbi:unnamed protein product [Symbiodinium sp. CCMP2592]|nr:unnamed protein product [Symbiodinium sp. CCMP2592]
MCIKYRVEASYQVWVPRAETVYTVTEPPQELPLEELTYLSLGTSRSIFQEAFVQDDSWETGRRKKRQLRTAGKQRGFLVRVAGDDQARVVPWFKAACKTLVADGVLSKVEAEEATNAKKLRKQSRAVAVNECRVDTVSRCHHGVCGPGFQVEVSSCDARQKLHLFTNHQVLPTQRWHACLTEAVKRTFGRVFVAPAEARNTERPDSKETGEVFIDAAPDRQRDEEEAWLSSLLGSDPHAAAVPEETEGPAQEAQEEAAPIEVAPHGAKEVRKRWGDYSDEDDAMPEEPSKDKEAGQVAQERRHLPRLSTEDDTRTEEPSKDKEARQVAQERRHLLRLSTEAILLPEADKKLVAGVAAPLLRIEAALPKVKAEEVAHQGSVQRKEVLPSRPLRADHAGAASPATELPQRSYSWLPTVTDLPIIDIDDEFGDWTELGCSPPRRQAIVELDETAVHRCPGRGSYQAAWKSDSWQEGSWSSGSCDWRGSWESPWYR